MRITQPATHTHKKKGTPHVRAFLIVDSTATKQNKTSKKNTLTGEQYQIASHTARPPSQIAYFCIAGRRGGGSIAL